MNFYQSISPYYDHIFPLNHNQIELVKSEIKRHSKVLDIGCATGNLSIELARLNYNVFGFDLDDEMIELATKKMNNNTVRPNLKVGNMINLTTDYQTSFFDAAICFGNTLVHLSNENQIEQFLLNCKQILNNGGKLLLQILNYNFIQSNRIRELPLIENDNIQFMRNYSERGDGLIDFKTKLTIKTENRVIENTVQLYPIHKNRLEALLIKVGFKRLEFYKSFELEPFDTHGIPLIVIAQC